MARTSRSWSGRALKKVRKPVTAKSDKQQLTVLIQAQREHKELRAEKYATKLYKMQLEIDMLAKRLQDIDNAGEDKRDVLAE